MTVKHRFNILDALSLIFITLKLCNVIQWNWFFVLLPTIFDLLLYTAFYVYVNKKTKP